MIDSHSLIVEIPIKDNQVIEVPLDDLPESSNDICDILDSEEVPLGLYLRFAVFFSLKFYNAL